MRYCVFILFFLLVLRSTVYAQTKAELEESRTKTLNEIAYVDNLLKTTAREKTESISAIKIIGNKLTLRESVIRGMRDEISLLSDRIELNTVAIDMMEDDLVDLKNEYARAVINSYRSQKGNPELVYILSARDFNQGYKRLKYLQQVTKFRRNEAEIITELKEQIEFTKKKLQNDLFKISDLKSREEQQKALLQTEQDKRQKMVKSLSSKEKQLKKDLEEKKRIAKKIEAEIARIIEEERKKALAARAENTPEQKLIGDNFAENKGRLPWPVERGIITSRFGIQNNAVLKYLKEDNIGIEITCSGKVLARSVFQGEVVNIFAIKGANLTIIIRHGKYLTVYANLINVKVKPGDKVSVKQELGEIFSNPADNGNSVLKFMIFETKYQDPELWIARNK
jgi:septal ring factor EnvC (AmiA/AmiB activator)